MKIGSSIYGLYSTSKSNKLGSSKSGYSGLKTSPRISISLASNMSDKDFKGDRSRKSKYRKSFGSAKGVDILNKKRNNDFTDYAYREAVNRLKYLLADTPNKFSHRQYDDSGDDADNISVLERPALSEISKYMPSNTSLMKYGSVKKFNYSNPSVKDPYMLKPINFQTTFITPAHSQTSESNQPPPELLNFIEKQEGYIEQLERESQFCRDELSGLLHKVKDVITENESLTDQAKTGINRTIFDKGNSSESEENEPRFKKYSAPKMVLSGPNIVFESRISELEAQLAQSTIDLERLNEENQSYKNKLAFGTAAANMPNESIEMYKNQIDSLQRDRQIFEEENKKLQAMIGQLKDSDAQNFSKTRRNRDLVEQAIFDKAQGEQEIKRLKEELERQHERIREMQHQMSRRIAEERSDAERRYNYQVDQLGGDLSNQWEQASKLQLELERQKRVEGDYRRELSQKMSQIEELKSEIKGKTMHLQSDILQVNAEKESLEEEITCFRLQLEKAERQHKIESARLSAEINSLRQRLDRADSDLLHSRRENMRLTEQISALQKDNSMSDYNREPKEKDMSRLLADMESKHTTTVSELEEMIHGQKQLMEKLTAECESLTNKLEDTSLKHKKEMSTIQSNVEYLTNRIISNDRINLKNSTIEESKPKPIEVLPKSDPEPVLSSYTTEEPIHKYEEDFKKPESPYTKKQEYSGNDTEKEFVEPIMETKTKEIVEEIINPEPYESNFTEQVQPQLYEEQPLQYDGSSTGYVQLNLDEYGQPIQDYSQPQQEYDPNLYDQQYQEQYEGQVVDQQYGDPNSVYDYDQQQYTQPQDQYQQQYQTEQYAADDQNVSQNYDPTISSEQMQPLEYSSNQPLEQYQEQSYDPAVDQYAVQQAPIENYNTAAMLQPNRIPDTEYLNQTAQPPVPRPVQNIDSTVDLKNT